MRINITIEREADDEVVEMIAPSVEIAVEKLYQWERHTRKQTHQYCEHICSSDCRRDGCDCACGEYHCPRDEKCRYDGEDCPNHPKSESSEN